MTETVDDFGIDLDTYKLAGFDPEIHAVDSNGNPRVNKDGSFAKKRGRAKGLGSTGTRKTSKSTGGVDYRPGLQGLVQTIAFPLAFVDPVDAYSVTMHAPPIVEAINELAKERPEIAAVLDKILSVGPYGVLFAACMPLVIQILSNHSLIPEQVAVGLGAHPRFLIEEELRKQAAAYTSTPEG